MSPPNPKRPPRSPRPPGDTASRPEPEVELPFDDDEVAPLQADDPRPQRVPQFPAGPRRRPRRGPGGSARDPRDRELPARFGSGEYEDPGHAPAFLYVERGPGTGQLLPIKQGVLVLGRASTSDLRLQHPSISRRHAQLTRRGDRLTLKDLGSQNGTYVNRARLTSEVEIRSGDELALGNALLQVRGPGSAPERPRATASRPASSLRVGMSSRRLVVLATTTGSLVAVFLTLAAVRLLRSRTEPASSGAQVKATQVLAAPAAVEETAVPEPHSAPVSNGEAKTEALARYEAGNVEAALSLARRAHLEPLAATLARFQDEWSAGNAALAARDSASAIQHLSAALELDQQIAKGWGAFAPKIRKALAQAHLQTESRRESNR
ncbi:FHA domain-containing protein [Archangium sp.]|uniref:FHA domain-containing protein n=1 Tax=Archangium sp. TaxID=1872627 RepID=UPI002D724F39|nr:FHA domain-containing protein [Archangium sp.]HYO59707.1 FHA domain-containing protein [Archangium sp.]